MSFLQPLMLVALPLIALPILIHLINQWRYQTKQWGAMQFLLAANKMNRGFAKIRQWLILAMRTLAIAGLLFAIARPLSSGLLGLAGGTKTDTTIVVVDRSPSMQEQSPSGISKLETAKTQLQDAFSKLKSDHWVAVDAASEPQTFESADALLDSAAFSSASSTTPLAGLLQSSLGYLQSNQPGPTDIWICSDLRSSDWDPDNASWNVLRDSFAELPQSIRFNLLAYPDPTQNNAAIRVTKAKRVTSDVGGILSNELLLSLQITKDADSSEPETIPVQIEIDGARSELAIDCSGSQTEIRDHRIPLPRNQETGWGRITLPADSNLADNDFYFVYAEEPLRRIVIVSDNRDATRAVEIAASISGSGQSNAQVEVIEPMQLDSLLVDDSALLVWQTELPDAATAPTVENYVSQGGQVIFFPPSRMTNQAGSVSDSNFAGISWGQWNATEKVMVDTWRGDQDLLAATQGGFGLPVGQLEFTGFAGLNTSGEVIKLASLTGGKPLIAKVPTDKGGVYFVTASPDPNASSLARGGIVLFVAIQRAIERGQKALGKTTQRTAGEDASNTADWKLVSGSANALSTEFSHQSGVYGNEESLFAINRQLSEDQRSQVTDEQLEAMFSGLTFNRVDQTAGSLSGIVREVWRIFLILMIVALLVEALLCIPRGARSRRASPSGSSLGGTQSKFGAT